MRVCVCVCVSVSPLLQYFAEKGYFFLCVCFVFGVVGCSYWSLMPCSNVLSCTPSLPSYPASTVLLLPLLFVLPSSLFFSFFCVPLSITLYCVCTNYCIALLCILKHKGKGKCSAIKLTNNEEKLPPALLKKKSSLLCRLFFISFRRCLLIHLLFIL